MIQLSGAGKRFAHKVLFEDCDWLIGPKDRIGIVGGNGTGKSTMLKILGGMEALDHGEMTVMRGLRMGYLPQEGLSLRGRTVFDECMSVFQGLKELETEMERLTHDMAVLDPNSPEYHQMSERFDRAQTEFLGRDGYAIESQVGTVLAGLGFNKEDWSRYTDEFSGGWQMRIALGKLLLERPNILLLDEPTNHLDLEARNWLESYLHDYPFAFVLISHDRYFLDVTVDKLMEVWNKKVWFYPGNYTKYQTLKQERFDHLRAVARNQNERIEQLEAFINRFRYQATKAKQVQSRIKELEKIERVEVPPEEGTIHFQFPQPKPSGRIVAEFKGVQKKYGEKLVLSNVNFMIERGDRIALVGHNGAGKSTLIKLLSGAEPLTKGEYISGHNVDTDYFAQDQYKELDGNSSILDDLSGAARNRTQTEIRSLLGCFLFSADDVFKKIGVLSGGERNRYALARLLLHPANFLLLDEPTNHLDMRAKDVLLEAMQNYSGTIVFVSHDRYFIDKLATKIFEIGDGEVRAFQGNYEDYIFRTQNGGAIPPPPELPDLKPLAAVKAPPAKRVNPIKLQQLKSECATLERRIGSLETEIAQGERELADYQSADHSAKTAAALDHKRKELERLVAEWESASQQIEEAG